MGKGWGRLARGMEFRGWGGVEVCGEEQKEGVWKRYRLGGSKIIGEGGVYGSSLLLSFF